LLEIEALRRLLFEKGIIIEEEFIAKFKKLDMEMKKKEGRQIFLSQFDSLGKGW
jgi:hypothetical protein